MPPCAPPGTRCSMQSSTQPSPRHHSQPDQQCVMLFGAGSPVIVDVEESCARCGWRIIAVVKNVPGDVYASDDSPLVEAGPDLRLIDPVLLPLFSPANQACPPAR